SASDTPELTRAVGGAVTFRSPKTATEGSASNTTELIGAVGGSVTFHSNNTDTKGNAAFWNFGTNAIVTVLFEDPPRPVFSKEEFKTRFTVSERGRALSISQLRMEDAGNYSVTIDGKKSTFILLVYSRCFYSSFLGFFYTKKREISDPSVPPEELTEPTMTCESQNCSDGRCSFSLRCSVTGTGFGDVSYTWRARDWHWEQQSMVIAVNKSSQGVPEPVTCTARNAVSSRNVTVTSPEGLCPGTLSQSGVGFGIIAAIGAAVAVLLGFLMFFCKSQATTGESTTVYAEVGPSQQRIPNGIKAKPGAGESSSTIYSLVKRPELLESATVTGLELV
ncbi:hypothetical protein HGM15179_022294, partial [Zosterops borbonicus]